MVYSQNCVNFKILWENGDEMAKGEWTRWKGKVGTLETRSKLAQTHPNKITSEEITQDSPKRVHSSEVGFFIVKLK